MKKARERERAQAMKDLQEKEKKAEE